MSFQMNYRTFQDYLKVGLLITRFRFFFTILALLVWNLASSQLAENKLEDAYYLLIKDQIKESEKSISYFAKDLQQEVDSGRLTKTSMEKMITKKLRYRKLLASKKCNEEFKWHLGLDLKHKFTLSNLFGKNVVSDLFNKVGADETHNLAKATALGIMIQQEQVEPTYGHSFSSPIKLDTNRYILYHKFSTSILSGYSELLIFCLDENGDYELERSIGGYIL
ncbi:hypothetical protein [uncultured Eudoraea sp.]|uniref:hypothetical protein n=1 Tax=uncultured Eudoraea sp. TaxID=1035614 RepID=UPI00261FD987|nr:hypothetical protein [uncultured Eudoraea sp.]